MNEFQQEIKDQLQKFRLQKIEPFMEHDDSCEKFREEIFTELGQLGFTGMMTPESYSGAGLGLYDNSLALEEIAKSSVPYAVTISVSNMVQAIINEFGNEKQKASFLPALATGKEIGSFCLSESCAGSDAAALKATAKKTDGGYILNGTKMWITSAGIAKVYIVMARTSDNGPKGISAFIIKDGAKGMTYGKKEKKMGWKTSATREVVFENCFVPQENLLKKEGDGFKIAMAGLDKGRISIASIAVGLAQRALDEAVKYSLTRQQFNQPIFEFQGLQFMMSEMSTEVEASRLLVEKASRLFDEGKSSQKYASIAKLKATDTAMKVTTDAVQILGGVGYTCEYPLERFMRDAKVLQIVEGTNQIQKIVIARNLKKEYQG